MLFQCVISDVTSGDSKSDTIDKTIDGTKSEHTREKRVTRSAARTAQQKQQKHGKDDGKETVVEGKLTTSHSDNIRILSTIYKCNFMHSINKLSTNRVSFTKAICPIHMKSYVINVNIRKKLLGKLNNICMYSFIQTK